MLAIQYDIPARFQAGEGGPHGALTNVMAVLAVLALLLWLYFDRTITRRLQLLADAVLAVGQAQTVGAIDIQSKDEIGLLARAIEAMSQDLSDNEDELHKLSQAVEQSMDSIVITDLDANIEYVNQAFIDNTGYRREEVIGQNPRILHSGKTPPSTYAEMWNRLSDGRSWKGELYNRRKDGSLYIEWATISPVRDNSGKITHYLGIKQDITRHKEAEDKLRNIAEVFRNTAEGIIITDSNGAIQEVNQAFTDITGYSHGEVLHQNPRFLQSGRHDKAFYQAMWASLLETGQWRGEIWNRRVDGEVYPELLSISAVYDGQGEVSGYIGVFSDISSLKEYEQRLEFLAHHDPLTRLPNRLLLDARLQHAIHHARRARGMLAVIFIDIDRFKYINDSLGHTAGDEVLKQLAQRLVRSVRSTDTVARISGDEFVVLLEDINGPEDVANVIKAITMTSATPFQAEHNELHLTFSMGISLYPDDGQKADELLRNADAAMYRAKDLGRNTYQFYTEDLTTAAFEHMYLESALRQAVQEERFRLVYQPQIDLGSRRYIGMEVLLRWDHPEQGTISPARFIPIAERVGLIRDIGQWVLRTACMQARRWLDQGIEFGRISVNVAGPQLQNDACIDTLKGILDETGLPPRQLEIEVTESFVMLGTREMIDKLNAFRELGIKIAIDDFGTGYSSLSYLKSLPIDKLKIDQSFIRDILHDPNDMAITEAIIAMGKALGMEVIAEGVEEAGQAELLQKRGCDQAQGYYFSRPVPPAELWFNAQ